MIEKKARALIRVLSQPSFSTKAKAIAQIPRSRRHKRYCRLRHSRAPIHPAERDGKAER